MTGHFLINPIGSAGDVNPFLALGLELRRRGHRVTVMTNPIHEEMVSSAGVEFLPVGTREEMLAVGRNPHIHRWSKAWKLALQWGAVGTMRQTYRLIAEHYQPGRTVAIAPGMGFGARIARDKLGIPLATVHLDPDKLRSLHRSPKMPPPLMLGDRVPRPLKAYQLWLADRFFVDRIIGPEANDFRRELGLPKVQRFVDRWWHSPDLVVGMFPEWYAPPQSDWPSQARLTDFPRWDPVGRSRIGARVREFLEAGTPPVVVVAGTAGPRSRSFFATCVEACRRAGKRGLLLCKRPKLIPDLPDGFLHGIYVPLSDVLARSLGVIHHGGIGTIAQGLAAGIPHLVSPMAFNQPDDARRLVRFGVAETISPQRFTAPRAAAALNRLIGNPEVLANCRRLARNFDEGDGIGPTCDLLESLIGRDSSELGGVARAPRVGAATSVVKG